MENLYTIDKRPPILIKLLQAFINLVYKLFFTAISFAAFQLNVQAQSYSSNNPGNFGIDGDLYSDQALNGTFTAAGSHDWFSKPGGTGIGVFDTVGAAYVAAQINAGANYGFSKSMQYPRYSTHGGDLYLDAIYTRDYMGNGGMLDKTAFNTANTNNSAMNPANWTTVPYGTSSIPQKVDIIDTYIHMRRLSSSSNHVIAYLGASTVATSGQRYFDFEFYKSKIGYDSTTGKFSNSGPAATGGHSAWSFNADGTINSFGDLTLSFSFSNTSVSSIDIYIWVSYATYSTVVPSAFAFTSRSWIGLSNNSGYGYAHIEPKSSASALQAWGMVSTATTAGPPWAGNYASGQFAEAAIDLTSLGIDPLIAASTDPCAPPYTRVLVKSRSSSSFSSSLQDFIGPIIFLNASPLAVIAAPSVLTCTQPSQVLKPEIFSANTNYTWSTTNGTIIPKTDSARTVINQPGTYYLSAASTNCNNGTTDSVLVLQDIYKPVATADYLGVLTPYPGSSVTLKGGNASASSYSTPFGGSQGLSWNWTGPNGFTSSVQDPTAYYEGEYQLTVTEKRNGCMATASTTVTYTTVLELGIANLKGYYQQDLKKVMLDWDVLHDKASGSMEVQKSNDGNSFFTIATIQANGNVLHYHYEDNSGLAQEQYYRIKAVSSTGVVYSPVIKVASGIYTTVKAYANSSNEIVVTYTASQNENITASLLYMNGQVINKISQQVLPGVTTFKLNNTANLPKGIYIVRIDNGRPVTAVKVIL